MRKRSKIPTKKSLFYEFETRIQNIDHNSLFSIRNKNGIQSISKFREYLDKRTTEDT